MLIVAIARLRVRARPLAAAPRQASIEVLTKARSFSITTVLCLALAGLALQAVAAGTGPHRWVIGGNIGACGSAPFWDRSGFKDTKTCHLGGILFFTES